MLATVLAGATPLFANLVTNGNFLDTDPSTLSIPYVDLSAGQNFAGARKVTTGTVDWVEQPNYWGAPPCGGNSVDLDGISPGGIEQTIATVSGTQYLLTFQLNTNSCGAPDPKLLLVNTRGGRCGLFSFALTLVATVLLKEMS